MKLIILLLIINPILAAIIGLLSGRYSLTAVLGSTINLVFSIYLMPVALNGKVIEITNYSFSLLKMVQFRLDPVSYLFIIIISLVWTLVSIYSVTYIKQDRKEMRYYTFLLLTLSFMMGIFIAGDLLSLFLFFELMTLSSYVLVVHNEDKEARQGGSYYLFMGIFGGLLVLWGITLIYSLTGQITIQSVLLQLEHLGFIKYLTAFLLIVGFGVKAGMFPVHIWLPQAHPVAPSPASALLSGLIIKVGAYGILRVVTTLYWSNGAGEGIILQNIGFVLLLIGAITMLWGVFKALLQKNVKRMLAYHSISQMGYIIVGIGIAGYLGVDGTLGFIGALYHIVNHALFKSSLFLIIGGFYLVTHQVKLKYLSGLGWKYPILAIAFLIAALGISGIPGFNGYISKTMLHHGLLEAYHHGHSGWVLAVEKIFIVTSAGTFCSFLKLGYYLFKREEVEQKLDHNAVSQPVRVVVMVFALFITLLGLRPGIVVEPLTQFLGSHYNCDLAVVSHLSFWGAKSLKDTLGYISLGGVIFLLAVKYSWFDYQLPERFSIDWVEKMSIIYNADYYRKLKQRFAILYTQQQSLTGSVADFLIQVDRNPDGNTDSLTIKSIKFNKLLIISMLIILFFWFYLFNL